MGKYIRNGETMWGTSNKAENIAYQDTNVKLELDEINNNLTKIDVYVGEDKKLHFVDSTGADSVLPFNSETNISALSMEYREVQHSNMAYVTYSTSRPIKLVACGSNAGVAVGSKTGIKNSVNVYIGSVSDYSFTVGYRTYATKLGIIICY